MCGTSCAFSTFENNTTIQWKPTCRATYQNNFNSNAMSPFIQHVVEISPSGHARRLDFMM